MSEGSDLWIKYFVTCHNVLSLLAKWWAEINLRSIHGRNLSECNYETNSNHINYILLDTRDYVVHWPRGFDMWRTRYNRDGDDWEDSMTAWLHYTINIGNVQQSGLQVFGQSHSRLVFDLSLWLIEMDHFGQSVRQVYVEESVNAKNIFYFPSNYRPV